VDQVQPCLAASLLSGHLIRCYAVRRRTVLYHTVLCLRLLLHPTMDPTVILPDDNFLRHTLQERDIRLYVLTVEMFLYGKA
jgi:hypothetical protein